MDIRGWKQFSDCFDLAGIWAIALFVDNLAKERKFFDAKFDFPSLDHDSIRTQSRKDLI